MLFYWLMVWLYFQFMDMVLFISTDSFCLFFMYFHTFSCILIFFLAWFLVYSTFPYSSSTQFLPCLFIIFLYLIMVSLGKNFWIINKKILTQCKFMLSRCKWVRYQSIKIKIVTIYLNTIIAKMSIYINILIYTYTCIKLF